MRVRQWAKNTMKCSVIAKPLRVYTKRNTVVYSFVSIARVYIQVNDISHSSQNV